MTEQTQADKDAAQAKALRRQPLERNPGESDFLYSRRLSRTLTEDQIKLAHDMHAIHAAQAAGFVLPPLPVFDEQKTIDAARAKELGVKPVERNPGELDAEFDARLAASEPLGVGAPPNTPPVSPESDNLPQNSGETDAAYKARNDANQSRIRAERDLDAKGVTTAPDFAPPPPAPAPHAFGNA